MNDLGNRLLLYVIPALGALIVIAVTSTVAWLDGATWPVSGILGELIDLVSTGLFYYCVFAVPIGLGLKVIDWMRRRGRGSANLH